MEKKMCEYKDCDQEAKFSLALADPDAEGNYYCAGHIDIAKQELMFDLFGWKRERCKVITYNGTQCKNAKRFGDYCGIHIKHHLGKKEVSIPPNPKGIGYP